MSRVWNTMGTCPNDRPVLVWSRECPFGARFGEGTVNIGQRGTGRLGGLWIGRQFFADGPQPHPGEVGAEIFTLWAEIPDLDATQ